MFSNPMDILAGGIDGGAGGITGPSSGADGRSGSATNSTGSKVFNLGATNPNTAGGFFSQPLVIVAIVAGVYMIAKR